MTKEGCLVHIVDDDAGVLRSLATLLRAHGHTTRTYASAEAFLADRDDGDGGVLLLDVRMPGINGLKLQAKLAEDGHELPIVFMTGHGDIPMAIEAIRAGAVDFIEKPFDDDILLDAIGRARTFVTDSAATDPVPASPPEAEAAEKLASLTARERDVFDQLVIGQTNKAIAFELGISQRTVEVHRGRIREKLQARGLADLIKLKQAAGG